jgi:uncharacterized protein (TIGR00266 family)
MRYLVKHAPSFALLEVSLAPDEELVADAGSMVARSPAIRVDVRLNAGRRAGFFAKLQAFAVAVLRKIAGGETLFMNHFRAPSGGFVWLAPPVSGAVKHVDLRGQRLLLLPGAYVASLGVVDLKVRWAGWRSIFSREASFLLEVSGKGDLWLTAYGSLEEIEVNGSYLVERGHLVAFDASLAYEVQGPALGLAPSGEGAAVELTGQGKVLLQTRNKIALAGWLARHLP